MLCELRGILKIEFALYLFAIVLNQWSRLRKVYLQTMSRCLHCIVVSLIQFSTTLIAHIRPFGREIVYIINIPAGFASLPASYSAQQHVIRDPQV